MRLVRCRLPGSRREVRHGYDLGEFGTWRPAHQHHPTTSLLISTTQLPASISEISDPAPFQERLALPSFSDSLRRASASAITTFNHLQQHTSPGCRTLSIPMLAPSSSAATKPSSSSCRQTSPRNLTRYPSSPGSRGKLLSAKPSVRWKKPTNWYNSPNRGIVER